MCAAPFVSRATARVAPTIHGLTKAMRCIVGATLAVALAPCSSEVFFDSRYKVYGVAGAASSIYKLAMKQKYIFFKKDGM
ncbi:MAG: hypothetical protein AUG45_04425 [Ktedonobacter sp. 13_1_20CM_3_54_15]|nr:MAG: hypothetical protein AUG45_04425 [Ktedonobacter sp. 13_1_20CM_3_54_15]